MTNKKDKIRFTSQRAIILEELKKVTSHPTAYEVFKMVRKRLPHIALGTVYRNLDLLAQNGMIRQLDGMGGQRRFDGNPLPHYHICCINCGRVDDVPVPAKSNLEEAATIACGYKILGHQVEFTGICPGCQRS